MGIQNYGGAEFLSSVSGNTETRNPADGIASLSTGDLRRKYDFSNDFTELGIDQTPFFRLVSKVGKKPTDDPMFKFTEKRQSWFRRYGYVVGYLNSSDAVTLDEAKLRNTSDANIDTGSVGEVFKLIMGTDYLSAGNIFNVIGQTGKDIGSSGTKPAFYLDKQIIKVNLTDTAGGSEDIKDYALFQVTSVNAAVTDAVTINSVDCKSDVVVLDTVCVRAPVSNSNIELCSFSGGGTPVVAHSAALTPMDSGHANAVSIAGNLEARRSYVVGTSFEEGSTLIQQTWMDQPYATSHGMTQIWRTEFGMTNTMRATALKYEPNEWLRVWKDKLIEHKWEIEQTLLYGAQGTQTIGGSDYQKTQGAADYISNYGNLFVMDHSTKRADDFLEDLSMFVDPRYNNAKDMVFFCDTATYNWLHTMGGYFSNNLDQMNDVGGRYDFAAKGKGKMFGVDFTTISTLYGDIKVVRNIHLDGSNMKVMGINMRYVKWRPLSGNGIGRDTSVYVGVQTLENTGTDKRVDMILTEGGFEWSMPECHAIWK